MNTTDMSVDVPDDPDDVSERAVDIDDVHRAVVTGTGWTTETVVSQIRRGNIQLNPRFQRRDAWDQTRKSRFIESLMLGLPIPQLVLAEDKRRRGAFIVLDGSSDYYLSGSLALTPRMILPSSVFVDWKFLGLRFRAKVSEI